MSLKTLLAVGESIFGNGPSPEARKRGHIPVFGPVDGDKENQGLTSVATDSATKPQEEIDFEKRREGRVKISPERRQIEAEPQERRRLLDRRWRGPAKNFTQAEMSLEQVRVVRNDLSDSDLELAPRRSARSAATDLNPFAPRPIAAIGRPTHEKLGMGTRVARWFRFLKKPRS